MSNSKDGTIFGNSLTKFDLIYFYLLIPIFDVCLVVESTVKKAKDLEKMSEILNMEELRREVGTETCTPHNIIVLCDALNMISTSHTCLKLLPQIKL